LDDEPAVLYREAAKFPVVTEDVTYYAVFAHETIVEGGSVPTEETFDFASMGLSGVISTPFTQNNVTVTFDKAGAGTAPTFYTDAIRLYAGGTMTVSAEAISQINLTFGASDKSNAITANVGTYANGEWTGSADQVIFTIGGSSGHRRIASVKVAMNGSGTISTFSRFITGYQSTTDIKNRESKIANRKLLINGQLYILVNDQLFNLQGQRVK